MLLTFVLTRQMLRDISMDYMISLPCAFISFQTIFPPLWQLIYCNFWPSICLLRPLNSVFTHAQKSLSDSSLHCLKEAKTPSWMTKASSDLGLTPSVKRIFQYSEKFLESKSHCGEYGMTVTPRTDSSQIKSTPTVHPGSGKTTRWH